MDTDRNSHKPWNDHDRPVDVDRIYANEKLQEKNILSMSSEMITL